MAVIRDVMPVFELYQPASIDDAIKLLDKHGPDGLALAGGLDSMDWLKDRLKKPNAVIDLGAIKELKGVKELNGGIEIGAMTPLTEVVKHPLVREKFSLLMEAAELVASPQIRNQGTLGGNVSQDTRCWYYRGGWTCYRAGGNICYADTPTSVNREHAIFDADRCVAVNPSDTAPALVALDASMVLRGPKGERIVPAEQYLDRPRHRHHPHEHPAAGRSPHRDPHPVDDGGSAVLFREGARSPGMGLPAGQRRLGDGRLGRQDRAGAVGGERGRGHAAAAQERRDGDHRQGAQ